MTCCIMRGQSATDFSLLRIQELSEMGASGPALRPLTGNHRRTA